MQQSSKDVSDVSPSQSSSEPQSTFSEKTERIRALSQFIKTITPLVWAVVILLVAFPLVGKVLISQSRSALDITEPAELVTTVVVEPRPDLSQLDQALVNAIQASHQATEAFAAAELSQWHDEMAPKVDNFLDWYFDYFTQKSMELKVPVVWLYSAVVHQFQSTAPTGREAIDEQLTQEFQREFSKRVLVPRNAQIRLENITQATIDFYLNDINRKLELVRQNYKVPQGDWERYLNDIATTINDTEGNLSNLSLKLLVGGGSYVLAKPLVALSVAKLGSKVSAKFASSAFAKVAAKTGGTVAAEFGTSLIDPLAGVGILLWDVWDFKHTVTRDRPILKTTLLDYLNDMETALLKSPETGIMSSIYQLEDGILKSLASSHA